MRSLRASPDAAAARAIALFTYRVVRECGALAACLGGVDLIAFTGGIGEHDAQLRAEVCEALGFLGVRLDRSTVELWVVPTDEGRVAARDAVALIEG